MADRNLLDVDLIEVEGKSPDAIAGLFAILFPMVHRLIQDLAGRNPDLVRHDSLLASGDDGEFLATAEAVIRVFRHLTPERLGSERDLHSFVHGVTEAVFFQYAGMPASSGWLASQLDAFAAESADSAGEVEKSWVREILDELKGSETKGDAASSRTVRKKSAGGSPLAGATGTGS